MRTNPTRAVERYDLIKALGPVPSWWRLRARRQWLQVFASIMAVDISEVAELFRGIYTEDRMREMSERPSVTFGKLRVIKTEKF